MQPVLRLRHRCGISGGVSVGVDVNYRENMPLASVPANVSPLAPARKPGFVSSFDGDDGVARGKTVHAVVNGLTIFADTPVGDGASLLMELAYSRWLDVTDNEQLFKGEDWYRGVDKVTRDNFVLGVNFAPTWYQVFPSVDIHLTITYNAGLSGHSAVQQGGNEAIRWASTSICATSTASISSTWTTSACSTPASR